MAYETIGYEKQGRIVRITLRQPSLSTAMHWELAQACDELTHDDEAWVVILAGEGEHFLEGGQAQGVGFAALAAVNRPIIAAINGDASAEGLELVLCCDLRVAAEGARFALPQVASGSIPGSGGTQRLARLVGRGKALEMLLLARSIDAEAALRFGLVNEVAPAAQVLTQAQSLAETLTTKGPIALRYAKEAIYKGMDMTLEQGLRLEMDLYLLTQTTADRAEGIQAFLERRTPAFRGE